MEPDNTTTTASKGAPTLCWFCEGEARRSCACGRAHCNVHRYESHCIVCALGFGLFDDMETEPVSDLIKLSLSAASGDAYLVVPSRLRSTEPLPLAGAERLVVSLMRMLQTTDPHVRHRAALVMANLTNSWPSMDPSRLAEHRYTISLLPVTQLRQWLLHVLTHSRTSSGETVAILILDRLRTADFRELYPHISDNLQTLRSAPVAACVHEVVQTLAEFYPTSRYALNERAELCVYALYTNRQQGVGQALERMFGPRLVNAPVLAKALKHGVRQSNYEQYLEWYPGDIEYDRYQG